MIEQAKIVLKSTFGYDEFISLQQEVIENVLRGRDTLAIMPTGGGKSICYQVPALLSQDLTVVVSPLIALMKDQVDQLSQHGVRAVLLNSALPVHVYRENILRIRRGEAKLLYVAPESLLKPQILDLIASLPVALLAIDEAHCISEWGADFRPEYRQLAAVRERMPGVACIALTATATPRVRQDIKTCLGFDDSSEFIARFDRENLFIGVVPKKDPFRQTVRFLRRFPNEAGIVYCLTRKGVDDLCAALQAEGFSTCPYHAGLPEAQRHLNQERFVKDEVRIIVATIAFGMGIDKSNIRFVLHYDLPLNIESYYQEIGRAGRDGMRAECLVLFSYGDAYKARALIDRKTGQDKRIASLQLKAMMRLAESEVCRRIPLLSYFDEVYPHQQCSMCDNCCGEARARTDVTIPAQMFLSCVKRTGERFGINHIIDVLRGSRAARVLKFGHDRLSTYGIGSAFSRDQWQQLARQFLHQALMAQDAEFGGLGLTPKGWDVLKHRETVFCVLDDPGAAEAPQQPADAGDQCSPQPDAMLFDILRLKRKELADAAGVPAYVIFSDRTLAGMAALLPRTGEEMLRVHGVGQFKLEQYGAIFLELIREHCRENPPVVEERPIVAPAPDAPAVELNARQIAIGQAFNSGVSVESLAGQFGVQRKRIIHHLYKYFQAGRPLRPERLRPLIALSDRDIEKALDTFRVLGFQLLKPVFEALAGEVGYDDLRIIRLYSRSLQNPSGPPDDVASEKGPYSRTIVCLAHSRKHSGVCIAGKEWLDGRAGEWIRPVRTASGGELSPDDIITQNGEAPGLLNLVTVPLLEHCPHGCQSENHLVSGGRWVLSGSLPIFEAGRLCDEPDRLWVNGYHSRGGLHDRIPEELAGGALGSSLLFLRPEELCITVEEGSRGLKRVRAEFRHRREKYRFTVTDPEIEARYLQRELGRYPAEGTEPFLTLSISEPFEGFCYKLAAAVIL